LRRLLWLAAKNITDDERAEFRNAMKGTHRIKTIAPVETTPPKAPRTRHQHPAQSNDPGFYIPAELPMTHGADDRLHFQRGGLQFRLLQKLKRGKIMPQASLDLHRLTVSESEDAVSRFLSSALTHHYRCVHIVHGKGRMTKDGQAKLKNWLDYWLRQHPGVLAYTSAQPKDGGTGAIYILLKRRNNEE